jgi:hypothetical protein
VESIGSPRGWAALGWAVLVGKTGWVTGRLGLMKAAAACVFAGPGLVEAASGRGMVPVVKS